jgi:hypothetical protein
VAAEPETGIITDEALTKAAGTDNSDPSVAERFVAAEPAQATPDPQHATDSDAAPACEWYGDSAYGTGGLRDAIARAGHLAVLKPKPLPVAVAGGFTVDDFTVDHAAGTVGCPNGHARPISATGVATFGALCGTCPLRQQCTTCKTGRKLVIGDHDALLRQARRDWAADPGCARTTGATGPTWSASSPSSPAVAAAASSCATWAWPPTTPGSSAAPPP